MGRTSTNSITCIFLIVFIPEICLGDDDLGKTLRSAKEVAHKPVTAEDYTECDMYVVIQDIELAIKKYHEGQIKQVINQIDHALKKMEFCLTFLSSMPFLKGGPEDIYQLDRLLKKSKKEAFSILYLGPAAMSPV
ncbi:hypothetical protein P3L10_005647 [Capsicum annuum]